MSLSCGPFGYLDIVIIWITSKTFWASQTYIQNPQEQEGFCLVELSFSTCC